MNPTMLIEITNLVLKIASAGPAIFDSVQKALPVAEGLIHKITSKTPPTMQEWADLHALIDGLNSELDAPEANP